ncbi:MAG TPA: KEOPS complex subunit Pcc1 [Candidatus Nanoarchaeia archaeon]|nr:KEOPS complex subunit Pcc1 [Candidatus Nanoarchaeia archaeon]
MLQATIRLEYPDRATAAAVANAVSPDNAKAPAGLTVVTHHENNVVITEISLDGKFATFTATIDDLLEAASTAEKALHIAKTSPDEG